MLMLLPARSSSTVLQTFSTDLFVHTPMMNEYCTTSKSSQRLCAPVDALTKLSRLLMIVVSASCFEAFWSANLSYARTSLMVFGNSASTSKKSVSFLWMDLLMYMMFDSSG